MIGKIRRKYEKLVTNRSRDTFKWVETGNPHVLCFIRQAQKEGRLIVIANSNMHKSESYSVSVSHHGKIRDLITGKDVEISDGIISGLLKAGQVLICECK